MLKIKQYCKFGRFLRSSESDNYEFLLSQELFAEIRCSKNWWKVRYSLICMNFNFWLFIKRCIKWYFELIAGCLTKKQWDFRVHIPVSAPHISWKLNESCSTLLYFILKKNDSIETHLDSRVNYLMLLFPSRIWPFSYPPFAQFFRNEGPGLLSWLLDWVA